MLRVTNHGSIVLLNPLDVSATEWLNTHIAEDAQWFGGAVAVEPRYVMDILIGAAEDGIEVLS